MNGSKNSAVRQPCRDREESANVVERRAAAATRPTRNERQREEAAPDPFRIGWTGDPTRPPGRDDILAGVALSWSRGGVDWTDRGGEAPGAGTYQSRMTSVHPYVGWSAHEGLRIWATAGLGAGDIEIDDAQAGRHESRVSMRTCRAR